MTKSRARLLRRARHQLRDLVAQGGLRLRRGRRRARRRRPGRRLRAARSRAATRPAPTTSLLLDRKDEFAERAGRAKALLANALYEGKYPLVSALSRPVIAEAIAEIALELGADAVVHGCTGKGNDQVRFELAFKADYPGVKVIAPLRDKRRGRVTRRSPTPPSAGIPVEAKPESPFSIDDNLFGRAIEAGRAGGSVGRAAGGARSSSPASPGAAAAARRGRDRLRSRAARSRSTATELPLAELIAALNEQAGAYGIGRDRHDREPGRGHQEPRALRGAGGDLPDRGAPGAGGPGADEGRGWSPKRELEPKWAQLVYDGFWFSPLRSAYDAFFAETQRL